MNIDAQDAQDNQDRRLLQETRTRAMIACGFEDVREHKPAVSGKNPVHPVHRCESKIYPCLTMNRFPATRRRRLFQVSFLQPLRGLSWSLVSLRGYLFVLSAPSWMIFIFLPSRQIPAPPTWPGAASGWPASWPGDPSLSALPRWTGSCPAFRRPTRGAERNWRSTRVCSHGR